MELSNYFTKPFDSKDWQTWVGVVIKAGTLGSSTYFTWNRCANDLDEAKELHWNHHYGFMTEDVKVSPKVRAWTSEDTSWTVGMVVSLALQGKPQQHPDFQPSDVHGEKMGRFWR